MYGRKECEYDDTWDPSVVFWAGAHVQQLGEEKERKKLRRLIPGDGSLSIHFNNNVPLTCAALAWDSAFVLEHDNICKSQPSQARLTGLAGSSSI